MIGKRLKDTQISPKSLLPCWSRSQTLGRYSLSGINLRGRKRQKKGGCKSLSDTLICLAIIITYGADALIKCADLQHRESDNWKCTLYSCNKAFNRYGQC